MPLIAVAAVLLAAMTHALWNLAAKKAARSRHFIWLYSVGSLIVYTPAVLWVVITQRPQFEAIHWMALCATGILHLGYSFLLQAGYRTSDLSLVYPLARGSGPLLSFFTAVVLLGEQITLLSVFGVVLVVAGILLVAGLTREPHKAPRAGIAYGLGTGVLIASYTINDGWAVKVLLISPFIVDYAGSVFRTVVLTPSVLRDPRGVAAEAREFFWPAAVVGVLGPLGYILVLFAMKIAPISHVAPARELATLIGAYLGARLLRERAAPARIAGAACIVLGVIALAFADSGA